MDIENRFGSGSGRSVRLHSVLLCRTFRMNVLNCADWYDILVLVSSLSRYSFGFK